MQGSSSFFLFWIFRREVDLSDNEASVGLFKVKGGVRKLTPPFVLSGRRDSNPRPLAWKANALPTELLPHGLFYLWAEMDSNHRSRTTADLQSAPFGHSGIRPCNENEPAAGTKVKIIFESAKIILPPCEIYPVPESVFRAVCRMIDAPG